MKKWFLFALLVCLGFFLVACGEEKVEPKVEYNVYFYENDQLLETKKVCENELVSQYEYTNGKHTLVGWYEVIDEVESTEIFDFTKPIKKETTLKAEWTATVTLKNYDGSVLEEIEVAKGQSFEPSKLPTRVSDGTYNYAFKGWSRSLVGTGKDITINAIFDSVKVTKKVTFFDKEGTELTNVEVEINSSVSKISYYPKDDNYYTYIVDGWKLEDGTKYNFTDPVTSDLKLYPIVSRYSLPMDFEGKTISMIGDSVSTFYNKGDSLVSYYNIENSYYYPLYCQEITKGSQTYWGQLINKLGLKLGINESYSGTTLFGSGNTVASSNYRINHLDDNGTPDIIYTFIGINDNVCGVSTVNFKYTYRSMLKKIMALCPNAYIFVVTHPYSNIHLNNNESAIKGRGAYSEETRLAYNQIILDLADELQLGVIRLDLCQTTENWNVYLADNLHPNQKGHNAWFNQFYKDIVNYFNQSKELIVLNYAIDDDTVMPETYEEMVHPGDVYELPIPTKEGYEFGGWYLDEEFGTEKITSAEQLTEDCVLYPEWNKKLANGYFSIRYVYNGGVNGSVDKEQYLKDFFKDYTAYVKSIGCPESEFDYFGDVYQGQKEFLSFKDLGYDGENKTFIYKTQEHEALRYRVFWEKDPDEIGSYPLINFFWNSTYSEKYQFIAEYLLACTSSPSCVGKDTKWPEVFLLELYGFFYNTKGEWPTHYDTPVDFSDPDKTLPNLGDYYTVKYQISNVNVTLPNAPTKEGYTFGGWYSNPEFTGSKVYVAKGNIKVYAKWIPNEPLTE